MNFQLTEEHEQLREMIRDFAVNEVAPTAAERDENEEFDRGIFDKMAELGLLGDIPASNQMSLMDLFQM